MNRLTTMLTSSLLLFASVTMAEAAENVDGDPQALHRIAAAVSARRIEADIGTLVGFGTRHTLSDTTSSVRGIGAARRWIKAEFEKISADCGGCLAIQYQREVIEGERRIPDPTEVVNVVAIQKGTQQPNRYVVMSADIDSRVSDPMDFQSDSPGANDNASGMAGVLEAARVLSKYRFPGSIAYAALSGEEQGLFGGRIMAGIAKREGWFVEAVLNNDMIGNIAGINNIVDNHSARVFSEGTRVVETQEEARIRRFSGGEVDSPSRNLARYIDLMADRYIPNLDVMMIYRLDRFGRGGHHRPFNEAGYPGVRIMETNEHYHRQHQDIRVEDGIEYGDVLEGVNFDYAAKLTALNAVTLASLAWAPGPPTDVSIEGAVSPHTTLKWRRGEDAASYKVYWRLTTSPVWTTSREVGDVAQYTLENVVIDNYFFGVTALSASGFESPVVFPGPAGSFQSASDANTND
ncbi:MAG: M28 family metallopeptidase [Pseudomonadales bacterium]|nr:M28 family metallopeptidase [Pseudomonadales bacterium]MDP7596322.1 M28 family metallopeptidase [Pseudomonadales bacterium]HJN50001.1 M28 family metallopeptidase [Pseudomonadales bacterium]